MAVFLECIVGNVVQLSRQQKTARDAAARAEQERLALQKRVQELERRIKELEADLQRERSTSEELRSQAERERNREQASGSASSSSSASKLRTSLKSTTGIKANGGRGAPSPQRQPLSSAPAPPHFAEFVEMKRRLAQALEDNAQLRASLQIARSKE